MSALRLLGATLCVPSLAALGWTAYTSRKVRGAVAVDPLAISPYCQKVLTRTKQDGTPCIMCAFKVPLLLQTADIRRKLEKRALDNSLYALHALLQSFFMRMEVTATAFLLRMRLSDARSCWASTSRVSLAGARSGHAEGQPAMYGQWEVRNEDDREVVLAYNSEAVAVSLELSAEGSRQAALCLSYVVQPFDMFEKNSIAEGVAMWGVEKYAKLLAAQAAHAIEHLEMR